MNKIKYAISKLKKLKKVKKEDVKSFINNMVERLPQAAIIKYITSKIADSIINKRDSIELL